MTREPPQPRERAVDKSRDGQARETPFALLAEERRIEPAAKQRLHRPDQQLGDGELEPMIAIR